MIEAVVKIASEHYYSCELTGSIPVRVSLIAINGPEGFGIIESLDGTEAPMKKYTKFMKRSKNILEFEITYKSAIEYWTRAVHHMEGKSIHETVLESGCMTRLPIIISSGKQTHTILAPSKEKFTKMIDNLRHTFTSVEIDIVRRFPRGFVVPVLTAKQEEAFRIAYKRGYYEMPRQCDITELSGGIKIKRVAFQERLRRAERAIMKQFASSQGIGR